MNGTIKLKSFCRAKESNQQSKKPTDDIRNNSHDKGLLPEIYKELVHLNKINTNNPVYKRAEDVNKDFSEEDI